MTVRLAADGTVQLEGACPIEDAEVLQRVLLAAPGATVDWRTCTAAHTAVVQILLAAKPILRGPPGDEFLRKCIAAHLEAAPGTAIDGGGQQVK